MKMSRPNLAIIGALVLGGTAVPMALAATSGPETTEPLAIIEVTHDSAADTMITCVGQDGHYQEIRSHNTGTMISADPRLTGVVTTDEHITIHIESLTGAVVGEMEVRDPVTGELKLDATIYAVFKGVPVKGVIVGELADGQRLVANFSAIHESTVSSPHRLIAEIGGPAGALDLSVVQTVGCTGEPQV